MEKSTQKTKVLKLHEHSVINAGEYPEDWRFLSLGDPISGNFSNGVNKDAKDYGNGCLFVNISDVFREFTIDPKKLGRVNVTDKEIENYKLEKGDLVLDRSSNIFETVGYPTYFDGYEEPVVFSGFTFRYRPNKGNWDPKFLTYQFMSYPIRKLVTSISTKSANSNVNQNSYKKIQVPCPPIQEQQKITSILLNVDSLIDRTQKEIELAQRLKKGLMQKLLTKGIGHTKFKKVKWNYGKILEISEDWKVVLLDEVAKRGSGHTPDAKIPEYYNGGIKWISLADSNKLDNVYISETEKEISEKGIENSSAMLHPSGVVVLSRDAGVGKSAITTKEMAVSQHFMAWQCGDKLNNHFLYYLLQFWKPFIEAIAIGTTIKTIGLPFFKKFKIILPPRQEQDKIVSVLLGIDKSLWKKQESKSNLETLKKGLMQKLLTGQIRVRV